MRLVEGGIDSVHRKFCWPGGKGFRLYLANVFALVLVQHAVSDLELFKELTYKTLQSIESHQSFDGNIIYAIGHEMIYCQGFADPTADIVCSI